MSLQSVCVAYSELKTECPTLNSLNIGGGFPIKKVTRLRIRLRLHDQGNSDSDKKMCQETDIPEPNIFTEFGSFTVGESGELCSKSCIKNNKMTGRNGT